MGDESNRTCPHCAAANQNQSAFCESCGKALPSAARSGPRLVTEAAMPSSAGGRQLVAEELKKHSKKAKGALLAVAIIQTIFGLIIFAASRANAANGNGIPPLVGMVVLAIGAIYFGLYAWARHNPLPAAIVGLILYVTMHTIDAIVDPTQLARGIILKIIIVVVLIQAIQAGVKYKRLAPQLQAT